MANLNAKMLIDEEGNEFVPLSFVQAIFSSDGSKNLETLLEECVKSVNGTVPDETGNINIEAGGGVETLGGATSEEAIDLREISDVGVYKIDGFCKYGPAGSSSRYMQAVLFIVSGKAGATGNYNLIQILMYNASQYGSSPAMAYRYKSVTATLFPNSFTTMALTNTTDMSSDRGTASNLAQGAGYTLNQRMGSLDNLLTTDKSSLVNAINEALSSGGGGGGASGGLGIKILAGTTENPIDLNDVREAGVYLVDTTYNTVKNLPTGANTYKKVLLLVEGLYGEYGPGFYNAILRQTVITNQGGVSNGAPDALGFSSRVFFNWSATNMSWQSWYTYYATRHVINFASNLSNSQSSYTMVTGGALQDFVSKYVVASISNNATNLANGALTNLETTNKSSLVAAINELNARLTALEGGTSE